MTTPADKPATPGTAPDQPPTPGLPPGAAAPARQHVIRRTRLGGVWTGLALAAIVLVFLLIFILENSQQASIAYFGTHGHLPLGVALLLAALAGALLVLIPGTGRILQLRRTARRHRHLDTQAAAQAIPPASTPPQQDGTPPTNPDR